MSTQDRFNRREVMKTSVLALGSGLLMSDARQAYSKVVNTNSSPSALKVADLRVATIGDRTDSPSQSRPFYVTLPTGQKGDRKSLRIAPEERIPLVATASPTSLLDCC